MAPLSSSELQNESLHAGDTIEYYSWAFVCGDKRGYRKARILRIASDENPENPVAVDTEEKLPLTMMLRRFADRFGNRFKRDFVKWRKLRSFKLIDGYVNLPTRASEFNAAMRLEIDAASAAVAGRLREEREARSSLLSSFEFSRAVDEASKTSGKPSSTCSPALKTILEGVRDEGGHLQHCPTKEERGDHLPADIINLVSDSESDTHEFELDCDTSSSTRSEAVPIALVNCNTSSDVEGASPSKRTDGSTPKPAVSDAEVLGAEAYLKKVPTRLERNRIGHKAKSRPATWKVNRSRKKQYQAKCAITRSGTEIYHARTLTATKMKAFLRLPGVRRRLKALHSRRPEFVEHAPRVEMPGLEVKWPAGIKRLEECLNPADIRFPDVGDYGKCDCVGNCFIDSCANAVSTIFCTEATCNLGAVCSNAPRIRSTLKLFDTGRVGLGVYTTTDLDVGDILGEYTGILSAYNAKVEGQPAEAMKQNSGYTMLYYTKSSNKKYVYVDAQTCGTITRFISHACEANAHFLEMRNGTTVKILVVMSEDVKEGTEITVNYGDEIWFTCACDECWKRPKNGKLNADVM